MRIRNATIDDVPRIVEMAQRFYALSGYTRIAPLAKESAAGIVILCIDDGVMLVAENDAGDLAGMICLRLEPYLFNVTVRLAQEIVWWVEPEARGGLLASRLRKAGEDAAKANGAQWIRMAVLPGSPPQAMSMLERANYSPSEAYVIKELV